MYPVLLPLHAGTEATGDEACPVPHRLLQSPVAAHGVSWRLPHLGVAEWPWRQLCCLLADANSIHVCWEKGWIEMLLPLQLRPFLKI